MPNLVNWISMLLYVPAIVILLGLVLCSCYDFSLTLVSLHESWTQPVKDSLPQQLYFTQLSGHSCYFYIFFKVFMLEGMHWFLLGQASW